MTAWREGHRDGPDSGSSRALERGGAARPLIEIAYELDLGRAGIDKHEANELDGVTLHQLGGLWRCCRFSRQTGAERDARDDDEGPNASGKRQTRDWRHSEDALSAPPRSASR